MRILWPGKATDSELRTLILIFGRSLQVIPYELDYKGPSRAPYDFVDFVMSHPDELVFTRSAACTAIAAGAQLRFAVVESSDKGIITVVVRMFDKDDSYPMTMLWPRTLQPEVTFAPVVH